MDRLQRLTVAVLLASSVGAEPGVDRQTGGRAVPTPNAQDWYVAASGDLVDADQLAALALEPPLDAAANPYAGDPGQAARGALVAANAKSLSTLRDGFAYPYVEPPNRSFTAAFPHLAKIRDLARLVRLEGQVKAGQGDLAGAVDSWLDGTRLGAEVAHGGGPLISALVGVACEELQRRDLWAVAHLLDEPTSRHALGRLELIAARQLAYPDALAEELWWMVGGLEEVADGVASPAGRAKLVEAGLPATFLDGLSAAVKRGGKQAVMDQWTVYCSHLVDWARQPYRPGEADLPPVPNPIFAEVVPSLAKARVILDRNQVQLDLLQLRLALHAWRLGHGTYPDRLEELVPGLLSRLPLDPFAGYQMYGYASNADVALLYSFGPDAADDGGTPIEGNIEPESQGDIVAGVNLR